MPISSKHNVAYIHIPRTAGGSIEKALGIYGIDNKGSSIYCSHIFYGYLTGSSKNSCTITHRGNCCNYWFNKLLYNDKYSVDNDLNRALQHWTFKELEEKKNLDNYFKFSFVRNPFDRLLSAFQWRHKKKITTPENFNDFIKHTVVANINTDRHLMRQHLFLTDSAGENMMSFVGKFENLEEDVKKLSAQINIPITLEKVHSSSDKNYRHFYDEESIKIVNELYAKDMKLFEYSF